VDVAVVVSDTAGRPWRVGVTDIALGAAGFAGLDDLRGRRDRYGNELHTTVVAVVDEVAAAADLVKGKTAGAPVAVLRGLRPRPPGQPDPGIRPLLRPAAEDLFPLGTAEARRDAVTARRSIRRFRPEPVPADVMVHAVAAALTAPAPHHSVPWRFVLVDSPQVRADLLDRMRTAWATDLTSDGFTEAQVARRIRRGDLLREAPSLVVPFCVRDGAHAYPDPRRSDAENAMFLVAMGAGVQNFLVALAAEGVGSCWVSSTLFCPDVARAALQVPDNWDPVGAVAVGYPDVIPPPRPDRVAGEHLLVR
jgi:coenzyme F420-0:L-glutamate ligase/coenzyme F420-1:gamma-L-glutamate ligase